MLQGINKTRKSRSEDLRNPLKNHAINNHDRESAPQKLNGDRSLPPKSILKKSRSTPNKRMLTRDNSIDIHDDSDEMRRSFYENLKPGMKIIEEKDLENTDVYENDTFHLTKDSVLFDKVAKNQLNECLNPVTTTPQVVEIKEREIEQSKVGSVLLHSVIHHGPHTVERVEIDDTETESANESTTDIDDMEDKWPSSPVFPSKLNKQRILSDDSILSSRESLKNCKIIEEDETKDVESERHVRSKSVENENPTDKNQLIPKQDNTTEVKPKISTSGDVKHLSVPDIRLRVTGIVNRTEFTTITTMNDKSRIKQENADLSSEKSNSIKSVKELKVRKEVEVSKTYELVGKYKDQEEDSFSESDKDNDEMVEFSEDEGVNTFRDYDTDSSTHSIDLSSKVLILFYFNFFIFNSHS